MVPFGQWEWDSPGNSLAMLAQRDHKKVYGSSGLCVQKYPGQWYGLSPYRFCCDCTCSVLFCSLLVCAAFYITRITLVYEHLPVAQ